MQSYTYNLIFLLMFSFNVVVHSGVLTGLRNNTLKIWIRNDLQSLKRLSQLRYRTYEKINNLYQKLLTYYYDATYHYYNMSDEDKDLINSILNMLF